MSHCQTCQRAHSPDRSSQVLHRRGNFLAINDNLTDIERGQRHRASEEDGRLGQVHPRTDPAVPSGIHRDKR